jgi:hypothetical protein
MKPYYIPADTNNPEPIFFGGQRAAMPVDTVATGGEYTGNQRADYSQGFG